MCLLAGCTSHVPCTMHLLACLLVEWSVMCKTHLLEFSSWEGKGSCLLLEVMKQVTTCLLPAMPCVLWNPHLKELPDVFNSFSTSLVVQKPVGNTEKSEREERKVTEKFKKKFMKNSEKNQRRGVSMDNPFSPSCDFNQCVLVWLRAEGLASKSLESPKFFSLRFYRLDMCSTWSLYQPSSS